MSVDPPACNAFAVHLDGDREALIAARDAVADSHGLVLFENLAPSAHPGAFFFELVVGPNTPEDVREIHDAFAELIARATSR